MKEIKRMEEDELLKFFLRKKLLFLTNNVLVLKILGGIEDMPRIPDVMYIADPHKEQIAVKEAKNLVSL